MAEMKEAKEAQANNPYDIEPTRNYHVVVDSEHSAFPLLRRAHLLGTGLGVVIAPLLGSPKYRLDAIHPSQTLQIA